MTEFDRKMYWLVNRQSNKTLAKWLYELNSWGWPKRIPDPEPQDVVGGPRRRAAMDAILRKLGWRMAAAVRAEAGA